MLAPKSWLPWVVLVVIGAIAGAWLARATRAPEAAAAPVLQSGTWLPQTRGIGAPQLVDSMGQPFTRDRFAGHASLLFFGFTHCPDVCPTTLALLAQAKRAANAPNLKVYLVSVDPERDTPEVLQAYLRRFDPEFIGLTGTPQDIKAFTRTLGAAVAKVDLPGGAYTMDHSATLFLLDEAAQLRAVFTPPYATASLAADLTAAAAAAGG